MNPPPKMLPRIVQGDLWELNAQGWWAVIPTNMQKGAYGVVMGAGLAKQAADRYPRLPHRYEGSIRAACGGAPGVWLQVEEAPAFTLAASGVMVCLDERLVLFPTKRAFYLDADPELIAQSFRFLRSAMMQRPEAYFALPTLGTGLGKLPREDFLELVREADLPLKRTIIVEQA